MEFRGTVRIGQITGTTDLDRPEAERKGPLLVDAEQWPLLQDTGRCGAIGVDSVPTPNMKADSISSFGNVWTGTSGIPINADLVAWVGEPHVLRRGGHLALGWKLVLPFEPTNAQGQRDWRFCGKCFALFFDGYAEKGVCPKDGTEHSVVGYNFLLPHNPGEDARTQGGLADVVLDRPCESGDSNAPSR